MTARAEVLKKAGYTRVVLLTQTSGAEQPRFLPMAANIRTSLKGVLADLSPDDTVLVALAGHGVQYSGENDNYFCPMDAKLADKTTLISLSEVYKDLEKSAAGTRLLLADCCRNDPRSEDARAADKIKLESVTRPQKSLPPGGVAAFFSCSAGEKAYERAELGHGVFFHFVIKGLQGDADLDKDGQVDLGELAQYTTKKVRNFVKDAYGDDVRQQPEMIGKTHGMVGLVKLDGGGRPDATTKVTVDSGRPDTTTEETNLKDEYTLTTLGMKMRLINPGKFLMGSPQDEKLRNANEGPQHEVEITKPFYMGVYPVTRGQFAAFVKDDGYQTEAEKAKEQDTWRDPHFTSYNQTDNDPVVKVSWNDAQAFCAWLSKKEGKKYELPREAEWEYACRAGTTTAFSFPDPKDLGDYAWYSSNSGSHTHSAGQKKSNPWGLHDMNGNVWQLCADGYGLYQEGSIKDPKGEMGANDRVLRGGSCIDEPRNCSSAVRQNRDPLSDLNGVPADRLGYTGFRVVLRPSSMVP